MQIKKFLSNNNTFFSVVFRKPAYPLFLALFRLIFSGFHSDFYLTAVIFAQSVLAAIAAWSFADYLSKEFKLNKLFSLMILFIPLFVSLLCRFAAQRESMYSNAILTEGISISCYLLFFRFVIELILLVLGILIIFFKSKKFLRGLSLSLFCVISILLCTSLLDYGYNYAIRRKFVISVTKMAT